VAFGLAAASFVQWLLLPVATGEPVWRFTLWTGIGAYLWHLSTQSTLRPKARGEIWYNLVILVGLVELAFSFLPPHGLWKTREQMGGAILIVASGVLLWRTKRRFHAQRKEHLLVEQIAARGDVLQAEYHRATPECPHPERWHMYDSLSAEVEVLDFLKALVIALKPELVVETGTFSGLSTLRIAEGLQANGFGRVITCELDKKVYDAARQRFDASGLAAWIDARNESSLDMKVDGRIDLLFCDSEGPLREQEVRRFLPQVNPNGLILIHDASSSLKIVREAALRLEAEGLLSVLLLPTPRGLVMAQKRQGRA
jgi:predicted O-methyltransferase YrrM